MKAENVYVADILICTKYQDRYAAKQEEAKIDMYKKDAILIKLGEQYIDLDTINSDLDLIKKNKNGLKTYYTQEGDIFVDNHSLRRYCYNRNEKITVKQLKRR